MALTNRQRLLPLSERFQPMPAAPQKRAASPKAPAKKPAKGKTAPAKKPRKKPAAPAPAPSVETPATATDATPPAAPATA